MREITKYLFTPFTLFAFFAAGTLTTLSGPFGTYVSMGIFVRGVYWFSLVGVSIAMSVILMRAVELQWPERSFLFRSTLASLIFVFTFTPFILFANYLAFGSFGLELIPLWRMYLIVGSVPALVNPLIYLVIRFRATNVEAIPEAKPEPVLEAIGQPRLFARLPEELGQDLIRMSVQDHMVHIYTAGGKEELRMRFGDAMAEAEGVPGLRVHRSHWVAENAVNGVCQNGSQIRLKLRDGSEVPVSRNYRAAVEEAGLLANVEGPTKEVPGKRARQSA